MKSDQTIGEYPINLIIRLKSGAQKCDDYELHSQKMSKTLTIFFFRWLTYQLILGERFSN